MPKKVTRQVHIGKGGCENDDKRNETLWLVITRGWFRLVVVVVVVGARSMGGPAHPDGALAAFFCFLACFLVSVVCRLASLMWFLFVLWSVSPLVVVVVVLVVAFETLFVVLCVYCLLLPCCVATRKRK